MLQLILPDNFQQLAAFLRKAYRLRFPQDGSLWVAAHCRYCRQHYMQRITVLVAVALTLMIVAHHISSLCCSSQSEPLDIDLSLLPTKPASGASQPSPAIMALAAYRSTPRSPSTTPACMVAHSRSRCIRLPGQATVRLAHDTVPLASSCAWSCGFWVRLLHLLWPSSASTYTALPCNSQVECIRAHSCLRCADDMLWRLYASQAKLGRKSSWRWHWQAQEHVAEMIASRWQLEACTVPRYALLMWQQACGQHLLQIATVLGRCCRRIGQARSALLRVHH